MAEILKNWAALRIPPYPWQLPEAPNEIAIFPLLLFSAPISLSQFHQRLLTPTHAGLSQGRVLFVSFFWVTLYDSEPRSLLCVVWSYQAQLYSAVGTLWVKENFPTMIKIQLWRHIFSWHPLNCIWQQYFAPRRRKLYRASQFSSLCYLRAHLLFTQTLTCIKIFNNGTTSLAHKMNNTTLRPN